MSKVTANPKMIVIDNTATPPHTSGDTKIRYEKDSLEELWEKKPGTGWKLVNVHLATGKGDEAEYRGTFLNPITLRPGESYTIGIFAPTQGPLSTDPLPRASLTVYAVLKEPEVRQLISDASRDWGGTWYAQSVITIVPTHVILVGASRTPTSIDSNGIPDLTPAKVDSNGIPDLVPPEGTLSPPPSPTQSHDFKLAPLVPGHYYFFTLMLVDNVGNWEVFHREFTTLKRKLTVKFPTLHIYNDSDPGSPGEAEFWFTIFKKSSTSGRDITIQDFYRSRGRIDDWSETDRPYALNFTYEGMAETVTPGEVDVWVQSWGVEHDEPDPHEGAGSRQIQLSLPAGQSETVTNSTFRMDCPATTNGDDFHYGVDVIYSVTYVL